MGFGLLQSWFAALLVVVVGQGEAFVGDRASTLRSLTRLVRGAMLVGGNVRSPGPLVPSGMLFSQRGTVLKHGGSLRQN